MLISEKELAGLARRTVLAPIEVGLEYLCMATDYKRGRGGKSDDSTDVLSDDDDDTFTTSPTKSTYATSSTMMRKGSYDRSGSYDYSGSFSGTGTYDTTTCGSKSTYSESMMKDESFDRCAKPKNAKVKNRKDDEDDCDDDDETVTCGATKPPVIKMNQCKNDKVHDSVLEKFYEKNSIMESIPSKKKKKKRGSDITSAPNSPRTIGGVSVGTEHREAWKVVVEDIQLSVQDFGLYAKQVSQVFKEGKCLKKIPTRSQRLKYNGRSTIATSSTAKAVLVDVSNERNQDVSMVTCPTWPSRTADDDNLSRHSITNIVGYADEYISTMDEIDECRPYEQYEEEEEEEDGKRYVCHQSHHQHYPALPDVSLKLLDRFDASTIATDENSIAARKTKMNTRRAEKMEKEEVVDHRDDTENMMTILDDWRKTRLEPRRRFRRKAPAVVVTTPGLEEETSTTPLFSATDNNQDHRRRKQTTSTKPTQPSGMVLCQTHLQLDVPYNTEALEKVLSSAGRTVKEKNNGNIGGGGGSRRNRLLKSIRLRRFKAAASNALSGGKKKNDAYKPLLSDDLSFDQSYAQMVWS